ncbi:efflux RND transporter periplasmic adaptor subunit [Duganella sp. FT80W]|uniref:Efflux RND transporter periplasmic adaptor subunit n=2 Tax=Duganella guangzhouensis TaxID=2666084 RepID=A0A6I2KVY6_9BURK|nr:efflux RND transporter periplasmic adaptor subunit [Duganella guangzhouensis]
MLLALSGCGKQTTTPAQHAAPAVDVITVHPTSVPVSIELPGRTTPYLVAQVRARVDGVVQQRSYTEGADLRAGQALYRIDDAPYRATLANAQAAQQKAAANLVAANAQAERYKNLVAGNAVSKQAYDNAVAAQGQAAADLAAAQAGVQTARINLGYTNVTSPIAGRSSVSQVTQGAYVQASAATLMTTVQQIDPIYVDLSQSSVAGLQLRQAIASGELRPDSNAQPAVSLKLEDGSTYPLQGKLQFTGITVDQATGTVGVRAVFPNPQHVLLPGMFVHASLVQGVNTKAMLVPAGAVSHNQQGQATALVVDAGGKVAQRILQADTLRGRDYVVTAGLQDGERVIVNSLQSVQPGMQVRVAAAPSTVAAAADAANGH